MNGDTILRFVGVMMVLLPAAGLLCGAPEQRHPGHRTQASFAPAKEFVVGGPVEVVLTIKNVGETEFTFMRGGRQRGHRDNQFAFSAGSFDRMLPDIGNPVNFGGIGVL